MTSSDQPPLQKVLADMMGGWTEQIGDPDDGPIPPVASVTKYGSTILISNDDAMDLGLIPDTRTHVPTPLRHRLRWRIREGLDAARMRVGSWIAGTDLDHECEIW